MRDAACRAGVHPGCELSFILLGVVRLLVNARCRSLACELSNTRCLTLSGTLTPHCASRMIFLRRLSVIFAEILCIGFRD
jgi:hypothetical protein